MKLHPTPVGLALLFAQCSSTFGFVPTSTSSIRSSKQQSQQHITRNIQLFQSPSVINSVIPETHELSVNTFAGMVEAGIKDRFQEGNVDRIIESWRLLERDYEHFEYIGDSKISPDDSDCHQQCHSYVAGLKAQCYWDDFDQYAPWASKLESKYKSIRDEFKRATKNMQQLQEKGNNIWASALTEDAAAYGKGWKTLVLMDRGVWDPVNVNLFPKTAKAIQDCKVPAVEVFFTNLKPNSYIEKHSDFTNFVLTSHLPIEIPYNGENKCRLTIGDETRQWLNGKVMMFDTSILHDACNESDRNRFLLMMRVWHPHLTQEERQALQFTYDALMVPELVTSDANSKERLQAEQQIQAMHEFPQIQRSGGASAGFGSGGGGGGGAKNKKKKKQKK